MFMNDPAKALLSLPEAVALRKKLRASGHKYAARITQIFELTVSFIHKRAAESASAVRCGGCYRVDVRNAAMLIFAVEYIKRGDYTLSLRDASATLWRECGGKEDIEKFVGISECLSPQRAKSGNFVGRGNINPHRCPP